MSFDKYDVIMKVLEIIEQEEKIANGSITRERISNITNIIQRLDGNIYQEQTGTKEVIVEGDKFENINQSVIATRGSIAKGVIQIREMHGDDIADALQLIEDALVGEQGQQLSEQSRQEALELLAEISQQGSKSNSSKTVLRTLGETFWKAIEKVEPLSKACLAAWKIVEKIWL